MEWVSVACWRVVEVVRSGIRAVLSVFGLTVMPEDRPTFGKNLKLLKCFTYPTHLYPPLSKRTWRSIFLASYDIIALICNMHLCNKNASHFFWTIYLSVYVQLQGQSDIGKTLDDFYCIFFKIRSNGGTESQTVYEKCVIFTRGVAVFRDISIR
jgi:hypothetical protein